jgi:endoglucanase
MGLRLGVIRARLVLAVCSALALGLSSGTAAAATGGVYVQGAHLIRDGAVWLPRGVQIVGLVAPQSVLSARYADANAHFGEAELEAAAAKHADLVRFQVSQYGLDPADPLYSPAYVQQVLGAVEMARGLGLTVVVSLQAEDPAGRARVCPLPDAGAERAWQQLAPMFAGDPGVMLELFNEPSLLASPTNWQLWEYGGPVAGSGGTLCQAVGMQTLIDEIRGAGADNVIIVPGLGGEGTLAGMPTLSDPANPADPQFAYGIHYPSLSAGSMRWDTYFGNTSASVPVIVSEWYASSFHLCSPDEPARAAWLLAYLASKQIGIVGYSFDVPGTIVSDWSYAPTNYANFSCEEPLPLWAEPTIGTHGGPGQLLFNEFAGLAQADGPSTGAPRGWVIDYSALRRMNTLAPGLVRHFFDTPRAFVIGAGATALGRMGLPAAIPTASFASESALARAINQRTLPFGTRAVIFDDEHWPQTPRAQQLHPAPYYQRAAQVAHRHALMLVAAPAPNVVLARNPKRSPSAIYANFLNRRIAAAAARYADVYLVQAQALESRRSPYAAVVQAMASQAAGAHPDVELLAAISSAPAGPSRRAPGLLLRAASSTASAVSGYSLGDPPSSGSCPRCVGQYDRTAVAFLRDLRSEGY